MIRITFKDGTQVTGELVWISPDLDVGSNWDRCFIKQPGEATAKGHFATPDMVEEI